MPLQESGEMYLETILVLSQKSNTVRAIDVGEYMGFSKPSVSRAISLLKEGGYVEVSKEGHLSLTDVGIEIASRIYERHQILTKVLINLGVPEKIAAADACKMEHDISNQSFEAIKKHLSNK
ncbi:MAG: metal-dependent transcriptional regulator [Clostridiales bacterium]|nr:metal-dependent transcriptional regulator [Candidatus Equinaster intestinalis]